MRMNGLSSTKEPIVTMAEIVLFANDLPELRTMVNALMTCGHPHNFVVQKDGLTLMTTVLGGKCITGVK